MIGDEWAEHVGDRGHIPLAAQDSDVVGANAIAAQTDVDEREVWRSEFLVPAHSWHPSTSYGCCGARRQRSVGQQMLDLDGFGDAESSLILTPAGERPEQSAQAPDAESGVPSVSGDARQSWYDLAMVVEDLRIELRGALAKTQSECESLIHQEAALREDHRAGFEAALLDINSSFREEVNCVARELRAGDAALGDRIVGLSARSARDDVVPGTENCQLGNGGAAARTVSGVAGLLRSHTSATGSGKAQAPGCANDISNDEARLQVLSSQIREKSQLFEEGKQVLERQLGAIRKQLAGEQAVREELHTALRAEIGQLSRSRSQEDCASQALLVDTAVTKALAEQRRFLDAFVVKQQKLMDERFAEQECSSVGRAAHVEALVERWVGEEDKARIAQASSTRASLDQFAEELRGDIARAREELQQTVTIDTQAAIASHRQDISQSIEDLRIMLIAAPQHCKVPGRGLLSVPESLAESAAETVVGDTACPTEFAQFRKSSPFQKLRDPPVSLPIASPSSSVAPALLRSGTGNAASMPSLLTRVSAPSPVQMISMGSLTGSMRLPATGPGSPRTAAPTLSPRWAAPAALARITGGAAVTPPVASAIPGNPAQEARNPPLSARRLSPPPHSPRASAPSRRGARRTLSPGAPLLASHS